MAQLSTAQRVRIAEGATAVVERRLELFAWMDTLSEEELDDELIDELVDILEHEPTVGGFLGVSKAQHAGHMARAHEIIAFLKNDKSAI